MTDTARVKPGYQAGRVSVDTNDWVALQTALREARERAETAEAGAAALREAVEVWRVADDAVLLAQSHHVHPQSPEFSAAGDLVDAAAERLRTVLTASDAGNALLERLRTAERERDEAIARAERYSDALVGMIENADRREAGEARDA